MLQVNSGLLFCYIMNILAHKLLYFFPRTGSDFPRHQTEPRKKESHVETFPLQNIELEDFLPHLLFHEQHAFKMSSISGSSPASLSYSIEKHRIRKAAMIQKNKLENSWLYFAKNIIHYQCWCDHHMCANILNVPCNIGGASLLFFLLSCDTDLFYEHTCVDWYITSMVKNGAPKATRF